MSRGPGRVMLAVEDRLTTKWRTLPALAADVFDSDPPTPSQVESVRRAVRRLKQQGKAQAVRDSHSNDENWSKERPPGIRQVALWTTSVEVRRPLTPEEAVEEKRRALAALKKMAKALGA
jgi:hypothetical protein